MRPETERHLNNAVDCFTGSDGGVAFIKLRMLIENLDVQAAKGDPSAMKTIDVLTRFSRLIDVAQKTIK